MKATLYILLLFLFCNCTQNKTAKTTDSTLKKETKTVKKDRLLSEEFKKYWYSGTAEISSYDLEQARYGEIRYGDMVMVYVTEPFDSKNQVKADTENKSNIAVMKLNATRNFLTGIYPYSIMSSTFVPVLYESDALKISGSIQEWCGHTYMQFNDNGNGYDMQLNSYFQSEGDVKTELPYAVTENGLMITARLNPKSLPLGTFQILPAVENLRLQHIKASAYEANASLKTQDKNYLYTVEIPKLKRRITYTIAIEFPHQIVEWTDTTRDNGNNLTTKATLKKTINEPYWSQNSNKDEVLRARLSL